MRIGKFTARRNLMFKCGFILDEHGFRIITENWIIAFGAYRF